MAAFLGLMHVLEVCESGHAWQHPEPPSAHYCQTNKCCTSRWNACHGEGPRHLSLQEFHSELAFVSRHWLYYTHTHTITLQSLSVAKQLLCNSTILMVCSSHQGYGQGVWRYCSSKHPDCLKVCCFFSWWKCQIIWIDDWGAMVL